MFSFNSLNNLRQLFKSLCVVSLMSMFLQRFLFSYTLFFPLNKQCFLVSVCFVGFFFWFIFGHLKKWPLHPVFADLLCVGSILVWLAGHTFSLGISSKRFRSSQVFSEHRSYLGLYMFFFNSPVYMYALGSLNFLKHLTPPSWDLRWSLCVHS